VAEAIDERRERAERRVLEGEVLADAVDVREVAIRHG
jgi:hypothetical protein